MADGTDLCAQSFSARAVILGVTDRRAPVGFAGIVRGEL